MDDLISRRDALELVRDVCDAIMSCCGSHYDEEMKDEVYDDIHEVATILKCNKEIRIALKNMPYVDAVPVIRCRDCKYNRNPPSAGNALCEQFYGMTDQNGFCHFWERRTDG